MLPFIYWRKYLVLKIYFLHISKPYKAKAVPLHPIMSLRIQFRRLVRFPQMMLWAFFMEGVETKQMLHTYARYGKGKLLLSTKTNRPTAEDLQKAKEQLKDIPRFLPFFVIVMVPAPGVAEGYALLAVTLEKWMGDRFKLLPSQFREVLKAGKTAPQKTGQQTKV